MTSLGARSLVFFTALTALTGQASRAEALTLTLCDFSDVSQLKLNGNATKQTPNPGAPFLQLTPDSKNQKGSAFYTTLVPLGAGASFHTSFQAQIAHANGADGFTFAMVSMAGGTGALGNDGGNLGYAGINNSVAVEFDTFQGGSDPNGNHIGIDKNGSVDSTATASPPFTMAGNTFNVWIDYDGGAQALSIYMALGNDKPVVPLLLQAFDLGGALGGQAYMGFTGATGGTTDSYRILSWELSTDGEPCVCGGATACHGASCGGTGVCDGCANDGQCSAPFGHCVTATKECVQCTTTTQCSPPTGVCDTTNAVCVACLGNGDCPATSPLCTTPAGGSPTCGPCTTSNDCTAQASATHHICATSGNAKGQCVGCNADGDCAAPNKRCDPTTNACVGCLSAADCSGNKPACDATGTCQKCSNDTDCGGQTPACQPAGGCAQCSSSNLTLCKPGQVCSAAGACTACTANADCPGTAPTCDAGLCRACKVDQDCAGSPLGIFCSTQGPTQGECYGCKDDSTCAPPTPRCNVAASSCVGCLTAADCGGITPVCLGGERVCGCSTDADCAAGAVCRTDQIATGLCQVSTSTTGTGGAGGTGGASASSASATGGAASGTGGAGGHGGGGASGTGGSGEKVLVGGAWGCNAAPGSAAGGVGLAAAMAALGLARRRRRHEGGSNETRS